MFKFFDNSWKIALKKIRMCLDPKHLNQVTRDQHYKLPTAEELFSEMHNATFSRKLYASSGY